MGRVLGEPATFEGDPCVRCGGVVRLVSTKRCRACNIRYGRQNKANNEERDRRRGEPCAICKQPMKQPCFDEVDGRLRGWLCHQCNVGLGKFRERDDLLTAAADYIRNQKHA